MWNEKIFRDEKSARAFKYQLDNVCYGVVSEFYFINNGYLVKWKKIKII